jgi:hypothetical protein
VLKTLNVFPVTRRMFHFTPELDPWHIGCSAHARNPRQAHRKKEMRMAPATEDVLRRVQGEFLEMPGLRLTEAQARRLWGLDSACCAALLGALVDSNFLFRTRDGAFMRVEHAAPLKATAKPRSRVAAA